MTKEHLIDSYGTLRYTIGTGCSGGSLAQQWVANAYPGDLSGHPADLLVPGRLEHRDAVPRLPPDARLLQGPDPLGRRSRLDAAADGCRPGPRHDRQLAGLRVGPVPRRRADRPLRRHHRRRALRPRQQPRRRPLLDPRRRDQHLRAARARSLEPAGEAASVTASPASRSTTSASSTGSERFASGTISPAQFVDLNAKIGGIDVDTNPIAERLEADRPALANAYRSGAINETNNLDRTAIIDCRGPDPGAFHDAYRAFALRARLDREHGDHDNQVIWEGPVPLLGDAQCETNSFLAMDGWLAAVKADHASGHDRREDRPRQARRHHRRLLRRRRPAGSATSSAARPW